MNSQPIPSLLLFCSLTLATAVACQDEQKPSGAAKKADKTATQKKTKPQVKVQPASAAAATASAKEATQVAAAEAESPQDEPEPVSPVPDIPSGRSKPPSHGEWRSAAELNTQGPNSQADNCQMKVVREWLKVYCHGDIVGFSDMAEFGEKFRDYFVAVRKGKSADFVVRLRQGKIQALKIQRKDARDAVLRVAWPASQTKPVHIALGRGNPPPVEEEEDPKKQAKEKPAKKK